MVSKNAIAIAVVALLFVGIAAVSWRGAGGSSPLTGLFTRTESSASQPVAAIPKVTLGYKRINVELPLFVAAERGYFKAEGLDVQLVRFASSNLEMEAVVRGDVDVGDSTASPVVFAVEGKQPGSVKIFAYSTPNANTDAQGPHYVSEILVKRDSTLSKVEELKGKKIAVYPGTLALSFTKLFLQKHGLSADDVSLQQMDSALQLPALANGAVDALITYEPLGTIGEANGISKRIDTAPFEREIINPWPSGAFILNGKFYAKRPDVARKVMRALNHAMADVQKEGAATNQYLLKYTGMDASVAMNVPVSGFWNACQIDKAKVDEMNDLFVNNQIVPARINPDAMVVGRELCA